MFDTKIAIVIRDDLAIWQKLNVTAFLTSGLVAQSPEIIGEPYRDAHGHVYNPMTIQPMVVLGADQDTLRSVHRRSVERHVRISAYTEEMFGTGYDAANRAVLLSSRQMTRNSWDSPCEPKGRSSTKSSREPGCIHDRI